MPGMPVVDEALIPADEPGHSTHRVRPAQHPTAPGDGTSSFRINCTFSHMRFDDPLVLPGEPGATHLHTFFGNTGADAHSTPASIRDSGDSTCTGGTANRSAYWSPSVIDTSTGRPVVSPDRPFFLMVYYKTGYSGVAHHEVQNFPDELRMLAGDPGATGPQPGVVEFSCTGASYGPEVLHATSFPDCRPGQLFTMAIIFPQCWDGERLDSADHRSHMAYASPGSGCPRSHPVPLAQITQNFRYRVPAAGMSDWRLSSDLDGRPAGHSAHADWMNGWDREVFDLVVTNCYRPGLECGMNLLGDGRELH